MPMPDKMGLSFTDLEITDLNMHFDAILTIINNKKVVQLTAKERQAAQSVSEKRFPYVQNTISTLAVDFANLQPNYMTHADAKEDFRATYQLRELTAKRNELNDRMIDFAMASEHFAYIYTRKFYSNAKEAQEVSTPGADTVVEALAPLFEGQGDSTAETPTP